MNYNENVQDPCFVLQWFLLKRDLLDIDFVVLSVL